MKDENSIYEWRICYLCSSHRFLRTPSGNLLCIMCNGDGCLHVKKDSMVMIPENLIRAIENGRIK